jgi:hypothetical protein
MHSRVYSLALILLMTGESFAEDLKTAVDVEKEATKIFAQFLNRDDHVSTYSDKLALAIRLSKELVESDVKPKIDQKDRLPLTIRLPARALSNQEFQRIVGKLQEYKLALSNFVFFCEENAVGGGLSDKGNIFYNGSPIALKEILADYAKDRSAAIRKYKDKIIFVVPHYDRIVLNFDSGQRLGDPDKNYFTGMMNISYRSEILSEWIEERNKSISDVRRKISTNNFRGFYFDPDLNGSDVLYVDSALLHSRVEFEAVLKATAIEWFEFSSTGGQAIGTVSVLGVLTALLGPRSLDDLQGPNSSLPIFQ